MKNLLIIAAFIAVSVFTLASCGAAIDAVNCHGSWAGSGYDVRYRFWAGACQVRVDGRWLPEGNVRSIDR